MRPLGAFYPMQGILGVFLREPLAEWQREARILRRAASRAAAGNAPADEDAHLALKVRMQPCLLREGVGFSKEVTPLFLS